MGGDSAIAMSCLRVYNSTFFDAGLVRVYNLFDRTYSMQVKKLHFLTSSCNQSSLHYGLHPSLIKSSVHGPTWIRLKRLQTLGEFIKMIKMIMNPKLYVLTSRSIPR